MCGECCVGYGGTYITEDDIKRIAEFTKVDGTSFVEKYCNLSAGKPVLAVDEDGKCVFFKNKCSIHPVKPRMCRAWPYIEGVLKEPSNWKLMATACEGIRTNFSDEDVVRCILEEQKKL
ncbi:MAG: YkgJ family cysteine cluster protein [Desulfobacterales bacterium]|nr:YkgJ family cysteine cluster protein [Desulfobacterales bacterium]MCP4158965.1 YkgJ family cysteine cluster protein [Deltaproteobacteria bacterium]